MLPFFITQVCTVHDVVTHNILKTLLRSSRRNIFDLFNWRKVKKKNV